MICITHASGQLLALNSFMPSLTGLMMLALNIASETTVLVKMELEKDVFFSRVDRTREFASRVGQEGLLITYYSSSRAVSYDLNSLQRHNCARN